MLYQHSNQKNGNIAVKKARRAKLPYRENVPWESGSVDRYNERPNVDSIIKRSHTRARLEGSGLPDCAISLGLKFSATTIWRSH